MLITLSWTVMFFANITITHAIYLYMLLAWLMNKIFRSSLSKYSLQTEQMASADLLLITE